VGQEVGTRLGVSDNDFRRRRVQAQTHWLSLLLLLALLLVYIRSFVFSPSPIFLLFFSAFDAASARAFCVKFNAAKVVCEMRCARWERQRRVWVVGGGW